jgi:hypothetical protein
MLGVIDKADLDELVHHVESEWPEQWTPAKRGGDEE